MSIQNKIIKDLAIKGEAKDLDGIAMYEEEYKKQPSFKHLEGDNYIQSMEAKHLRTYQIVLAKINNYKEGDDL